MTFNEWLEEVECFIVREERLQCTFAHLNKHDWEEHMEWQEAAYRVGYQEGRNENQGVPF